MGSTCSCWSAWEENPSPCGPYESKRITPPSPTACKFQDEISGWNGCMPQPAPWNPEILTTCGENGIQIRTCEHMCVRYPSNLGGCKYGDQNCQWLQQPWSFQQSKPCGPQ